MRFLHTSDWHLGRGLHGLSLHDAQTAVMDQIVDIARSEQVDAVLVAGDVYDRAYPPIQAVELLNDTLRRLAEVAPVILTPGNHDSATRLGFCADLYTDSLHVRSRIEDLDQPVVLSDDHGEVLVYPLPYLDPDDVRGRFGHDLERSHEAVTSAAMDRVRADVARRGDPRSVVMAHAFVVGTSGRGSAVTSESERDLTVGTVDCVGSHVFEGIDYVALGHLHGRQNPSSATGTVLHYSGSPLRYSFSEAAHAKSVTIVDLDPTGGVSLRYVDLQQPRSMVRLRGRLSDLLDPSGPHVVHASAWIQVVVTDATRPADMVARLRAAYPHCLTIQHQPEGVEPLPGRGVNADAMTPREVLADFFTQMGGAPLTEQERDALEPVLVSVFGREE